MNENGNGNHRMAAFPGSPFLVGCICVFVALFVSLGVPGMCTEPRWLDKNSHCPILTHIHTHTYTHTHTSFARSRECTDRKKRDTSMYTVTDGHQITNDSFDPQQGVTACLLCTRTHTQTLTQTLTLTHTHTLPPPFTMSLSCLSRPLSFPPLPSPPLCFRLYRTWIPREAASAKQPNFKIAHPTLLP